MSRFWDNWATAYRNWRAAFAALMLAAVLVYGWVLHGMYAKEKVVSTERTMGTVTRIIEMGRPEKANPLYVGTIALGDGRLVRVILARPVPAVGDQVPLISETYQNGEVFYFLDAERWRIDGPG